MNPENVKIQKWLRALIKNGPYDMEEMSSRCSHINISTIEDIQHPRFPVLSHTIGVFIAHRFCMF